MMPHQLQHAMATLALVTLTAAVLAADALGDSPSQQALRMQQHHQKQQRDPAVHVFVVADWGGVGESPYVTPYELTVAAAMDTMSGQLGPVESVLALGDNFYSNGVRSVDDDRFRTTFEDVFNGKRLLATPWYLIAGNHDWLGNVSAQILYSKRSKRWHFPDYFYTKLVQLPGGQCAAFIMVDTVLLANSTTAIQPDFAPSQPLMQSADSDGGAWLPGVSVDKLYDWVEQQLIKYQYCPYLFVAGHHPVWSMGYHGPTPSLVARLDPLLVKHRVTAYLCGHEHNMQHIVMNGTDYIVSGAAAHVRASTNHMGLFPPGSIRYYWDQAGDLDGAFTVLTFGDGHANATFVEAGTEARRLYRTQLMPRKLAMVESEAGWGGRDGHL